MTSHLPGGRPPDVRADEPDRKKRDPIRPACPDETCVQPRYCLPTTPGHCRWVSPRTENLAEGRGQPYRVVPSSVWRRHVGEGEGGTKWFRRLPELLLRAGHGAGVGEHDIKSQ